MVSEEDVDFPDVALCDPPPDPELNAELVLLVSPPVASAVLLLLALPLPLALWLELPPLPPVAELDALPELPDFAVDELLPSLLEELDFALPVLPVPAPLYASPPFDESC